MSRTPEAASPTPAPSEDDVTRRRLVVTAGILMSAAFVWRLAMEPRWTRRVPPDWSWQAHFVGIDTLPDPETGELPIKDTLGVYDRAIAIKAYSETGDTVVLEDRYAVRDPSTGAVMSQQVIEASVDPRTGVLRAGPYAGETFLFPREVERRTYKMRTAHLQGILVTFEREDEIAGTTTLVFSE